MKTTSILLVPALLSGCILLEDGKITETCDELGTCDGISSGGIVFAAKSESEARWSASVLDGLGDELNPAISRDGQGEGLGPIVYNDSNDTIYINIGESLRTLKTAGGTEKISGIPPLSDGIPIGDNAVFVFEGDNSAGSLPGFLWAEDDQATIIPWPIPQSKPVAIFPSSHSNDDASTSIQSFAVLFHTSNKIPSIAEFEANTDMGTISETQNGGITNFDSMNGRSIDAFTIEDGYATCAATGAIFLVDDLLANNTDPSRYNAALPGGDVIACDYEEETELVVLFSEDGSISWMTAQNEIVRSIKGTDGYRIVHGSTW